MFLPLKKKLGLLFVLISFCQAANGKLLVSDTTGRIGKLVETLKNYESQDEDSVIARGLKLIAYATEVNAQKFIHMGRCILADTYYDQGKYPVAIEDYKLALELENRFNLGKKAHILNNIGRAYRRLRNRPKALEYFYKSLDLAKEEKNIELEATVYNNVAIIYESDGHDSLAIAYYQLSIKYHALCNDSAGIALANSNLGELYLGQKKITEAKECLEKAFSIAKQIKDDRQIAFSISNLGLVALEEGDDKRALECFLKAQSIYEKMRVVVYVAEGKINIAKAYESLGDQKLAMHYAQEAWTMATDLETYDLLIESAEVLAHIHEKQNNFKQALKYQQQATDLAENLRESENEAALDNYIAKYELEKRDLKTQALEQDLKVKELQGERQKIINYSMVTGTVILLVLVTILWSTVKQKQKANTLLVQSREVVEKQNDDLKKLSAIKDKLFSIMAHDFRGPLSSLTGLLPLLQAGHLTEAEQASVMKKLSEQLNATTYFLENLLQWSRNQLAELKPDLIVFDIKGLAHECTNLLSGVAASKDIHITNSVQSHTVEADIEMTRFILRNLISNAIKFSHDGAEVQLLSSQQDQIVTISIRDQGKGIAAKQLKQLFTLETVINLGTRNERGTGLGLMLCQEFAKANGGAIYVQSQEGKGATFQFTLRASQF